MAKDSTVVSIDFKPVESGNAVVTVFDRGFLFGDSVYEVVRTYGRKPFAFERHYRRLRRSAESLGFALPFDKPQLRTHFNEMIGRLDRESSSLRVIVTRGAGELSLYPLKKPRPLTVVIAQALPNWPETYYRQGISLRVVDIRRNSRGALDPMIKSGNYLNNVLASMSAREAGAVDAVMLNAEGYVTESSTANIFMVMDGMLVTPPIEAGILDGVTRHVVLELAREHDIRCECRCFDARELERASECFLTSTTREVMPVCRLDDVAIPAPGPITTRVGELLREFVRKA